VLPDGRALAEGETPDIRPGHAAFRRDPARHRICRLSQLAPLDEAKVGAGRNAMMIKALAISVGVLATAASAALATGLTDRLQAERMTVLRVDHTKSRFLCAEHRAWLTVARADVAALASGDIVSVEQRDGRVAKVKVVRAAADELASPER
jgi:hypothetical protein